MKPAMEDINGALNTPVKTRVDLTGKGNNTRFKNYYTKLLVNIIIVPLHEILDNIYQLLSHSPTCQSSLSFTPVQKVTDRTQDLDTLPTPHHTINRRGRMQHHFFRLTLMVGFAG